MPERTNVLGNDWDSDFYNNYGGRNSDGGYVRRRYLERSFWNVYRK